VVSSAAPNWISPSLSIVRNADAQTVVKVGGAWNLRSLRPVVTAMRQELSGTVATAHWDLTDISRLDHAGAMMLWHAWGRRRAEHLTLRPEHETFFAHLEAGPALADLPVKFVERRRRVWAAGRAIVTLGEHIIQVVYLLGTVSLAFCEAVRHPSRMPWREISANIYRTGAQALGITALVGFLIGVVLSYLSAQQLKAYGAGIFIVNLLGISVVRELGPVLAAILVAGRSGSAMTAQLGVMRVTEEIDAMSVMGIPYTLRLVLPRVIALSISMPLIVLWTNAIALVGGMVAAQYELDISLSYFVAELPNAVPVANLWLGLGKGVVFGGLIALLACHFGLRIQPNTESLGIGTTNSVVAAITIVIIVDAIFAILFSSVGV